ncbi:MAG: CBS domain-containing protein [Candidatus Pacearchaeota archaeon]
MRTLMASDIMNPYPITVRPDDNLFECAKKIVKKHVDVLIIAEKDEFKGFITQKDILWAVIKKVNLLKTKAKDVSPKKVVTIKPSETIEGIIKKMDKFKFYKLPVVQEGKVKGIINMKDIIKLHPDILFNLQEIKSRRDEVKNIKRGKFGEKKVEVYNGICDGCGERRNLYRENGSLLCSSCIESI